MAFDAPLLIKNLIRLESNVLEVVNGSLFPAEFYWELLVSYGYLSVKDYEAIWKKSNYLFRPEIIHSFVINIIIGKLR